MVKSVKTIQIFGGNTVGNASGKKAGILLLRDYFYSHTDPEHPVSAIELTDYLMKNGISSSRTTIYSDILVLRDEYGMDIIYENHGYYLASREFELEELKLLVDMVESSNFITRKKTKELVTKLKGLTSVYESGKLGRKFYLRDAVKSDNESIYITVDMVSEAISQNRQILFRYFRYNVKKEKELSHGGMVHEISPFALIWVDQNYYLLGYDSANLEMRHYRIDRMTGVCISDKEREGHKVFEKTDMSTYTTKVFHMFTGDEVAVTLRCRNYVIDSIIDRFGQDIMVIPDGSDYFTFRTNVVVSNQFYAWLSSFGKDIEIVRPAYIRREIFSRMSDIAGLYSDE